MADRRPAFLDFTEFSKIKKQDCGEEKKNNYNSTDDNIEGGDHFSRESMTFAKEEFQELGVIGDGHIFKVLHMKTSVLMAEKIISSLMFNPKTQFQILLRLKPS